MDASPFKKLSAELRNEIYLLALTGSNPIPILDRDDEGIYQAPLTLTCKQIRKESLLILLANNTFTLPLGLGNSFYASKRKAFEARAQAAQAWNSTTLKDCHAAIGSLVVSCVVKYNPYRADILEKTLNNLARRLRKCGYGSDRVKLVVQFQRMWMWTEAGMRSLCERMGFEQVEVRWFKGCCAQDSEWWDWDWD